MKLALLSGLVLLGLHTSIPGCNKDPAGAKPGGSASGRAHPSSSAPRPDGSGDAAAAERAAQMRASIARVVNPKAEDPYRGPTGTIKGVVTITGDAPPDTGVAIPSKCVEGQVVHGKLFRVGQDRTVGDALVAVTEYTGFVPAKSPAMKVAIKGCALSRRTLALAFGQRLEVSNTDSVDSYMPFLDGAPSKVVMVASPGGDPVKLYPPEPGHYLLRDQLPNPHMVADVFVLAYATHDVTGLDGRFEIKGVPVGNAKISAYLPAINKTVERAINVVEGVNSMNLALAFDLKADTAPPAPSASASAGAAAGAPGKK